MEQTTKRMNTFNRSNVTLFECRIAFVIGLVVVSVAPKELQANS
jgi:hypothetical protein